MSELLPCPFCGGGAVLTDSIEAWVECAECHARTDMKVGFLAAAAAWNTRSGGAERAEAMVERLIEAGSGLYLETVPDYFTPEAYPNSVWTDWNAAVSDWLNQKGGVE